MPESAGYGFAQFEFGESLTRNYSCSYTVLRKLGWGMNSSTWLVQDQSNQAYFALKALTGSCTKYAAKGVSWELPALQRISSTVGHDPSPYCLRLVDHFFLPGKGSAGRHLCLVTPLFGGDITRYARTSNLLRYPLPLAKRILLHTLRALNVLHECGVVHTDIKCDNIFFDSTLKNEGIRMLLESDPSRRHQGEASYDGIVHVAVSQPLPLPTIEKFVKRTFVLGDMGSAQLIGQRITDHICPEGLRPPEIYIGGPWDEKVDIWLFGCLVYEVVTGVPLFIAKEVHQDGVKLDKTEYMLIQMMGHTREGFLAKQLNVSPLAGHYFNEICSLKKEPKTTYVFLTENWVVENSDGDISMDNAKEVVRFMRRCLRLDPADRASAKELLQDEWFEDAD